MKIKTFGCKVNTYDSGRLNDQMTGFEEDVHLINTCAVTREASQEAVRQIRKIKRQSPDTKIVVTGCSAQVDTEMFSDMPEVDLIVANSHKSSIRELIAKELFSNKKLLSEKYNSNSGPKIYKSNIFKKDDLDPGGGVEPGHTRSFLKIQDGCNSFCTFCVIPFARGKSRSIPSEILVERINELYDQGVKEIVLTGVHIGDYVTDGSKLSPKDYKQGEYLPDLIKILLKETKMPRFRLSSLEPIELSDKLFELYQEERLCPHFHMSIQSANTQILQAMKRKYSQVDVIKSLKDINKKVPGAFVGMDVIVGFPGEGEEEFADTYQTLDKLPWSKIHVFPYSQRPGTYAEKLENQNHGSEIKARARRLRELSDQRWNSLAQSQVGHTKSALFLNKGAISKDYWSIQLDEKKKDLFMPGSIVDLKISGWNDKGLMAEL